MRAPSTDYATEGSRPTVTGPRRALLRVPFFSRLSERQIVELMSRCVMKALNRNTLVISEGDRTDSMYVILSGGVRVFLDDARGKEITLANLGPHDYFGEIAPLDGSPRSASVITVKRSSFLIIAKPDLMRCLSDDPELCFDVIRTLTLRVRSLNEKARTLALKDVTGRVRSALLELATPQGEELVVTSKPTQQDLANIVGASREMVARVLKDLVSDGYLSVEPERVVIHDAPRHRT